MACGAKLLEFAGADKDALFKGAHGFVIAFDGIRKGFAYLAPMFGHVAESFVEFVTNFANFFGVFGESVLFPAV